MTQTCIKTLNNEKREITMKYKEQFKYLKTKHSWHLVDPSPWPLVASLGAFMMTSGGVLYMHNFYGGGNLCFTGFIINFIRNVYLVERYSKRSDF